MNTKSNTSIFRRVTSVGVVSIALLGSVLFSGCSAHRVPEIKAQAERVWSEAGYEVLGYEGYQYGGPGSGWGGKVWYIVRRKDDNRVTYHGYLVKWGDEYHIYNLSAIDAIKPQ